jgi:hypothetical protein
MLEYEMAIRYNRHDTKIMLMLQNAAHWRVHI